MSKIDLSDTVTTTLVKMAQGNPGALQTMVELIKSGPIIDPQAAMPDVLPLLNLDSYEIYGSDIYILYNDKCGRDVRKMMVLLRATQLGFMSPTLLQALAADQTRSVNLTDEKFNALDAQVCATLSGFQRPPTTDTSHESI